MKSCELCKSMARIYCDSDQASLCWTCDGKVHSANFLVARHSRNLLCRVCQSPTPWTASGEKLCPSAVSVCEKCASDEVVVDDDDREESRGEIEDDDVDVYDGDDDDDENEGEEEDDNQVVPLCTTPPPPAASSSSSSDDLSIVEETVLMKRKRQNAAPDLSSEDDVSVRKNRREMLTAANGTTFYEFLPPNSEDIAGKGREKTAGGTGKAVVFGLDLNRN